MSKVIKAPVFKDDPRAIETPKAAPEPVAADGNAETENDDFNDETRAAMLQEIAAKEDRANQLLRDAQVQADILRQNAQTDYDKRMNEVQAEIDAQREEARQQGHDEGFAEGKAEGTEQAKKDMADAMNAANAKAEKTLRDAKEAAQDYVQHAEEQIVTIAMAAVEKILPQHFIDVPQVVLPVVRNAISQVKDQKEIVVHVPPDAYDMVLMARDEFRSMLPGGDTSLEIQSDEALKPGDCMIETPNGSVDARLLTQIEAVKQAVRDVMA